MRSAKLMIVLFCTLYVTGAQGVTTQVNPYKLKEGGEGKLCISCHPGMDEVLRRPVVHTPVKKQDCSGCHNPHAARHGKLLGADSSQLCVSCHGEMIPATAASRHQPVKDRMCLQCHDPHASSVRGNLRTSVNLLCLGCHADMGSRLANNSRKHQPVEQDCLKCHEAHASSKGPFLLRNDVPALCVSCHRTDQSIFAKRHLQYPVAKARCTSCHDPHGSENPGIIYSNAHKPVIGKMCSQCHLETGSTDPLKLKRQGTELCKGCHGGLVADALSKPRPHWPVLDTKGCLSCHNPHGGPAKALLKAEEGKLCGGCHVDTIERHDRSVSKHQPIAEGRCTSCHQPHASDYQFLLKSDSGEGFCVACHDWHKHATHPIGNGVKDPRNGSLNVSCLSCHRSHGTDYKHLVPFGSVSELCTQCHEKYKR